MNNDRQQQWRRLRTANLIAMASSSMSSLSSDSSQPLQKNLIRSVSLPNFSGSQLEPLSETVVSRDQVPAAVTLSNDHVTESDEFFDPFLLQELHNDVFLRQLNFNFFRNFEDFHKCLSQDDDPIAGILNLDVVNMEKACCLQKKLLVDLVKERRDRDKSTFTQFGKRLYEMAVNYSNESLAMTLADYWNVLLRDNNGLFVDLNEYFEITFQEVDEDHVEWCFGECSVCLAPCRFVRKPPCCRKAICQICWQNYVRTTAKNSLALHVTGVYNLHCYYCANLVPYSQAMACTDSRDMDLIRPKLLGANSAARCPICLEPAPALVDKIVVETKPKKQAAKLKKLRQRKGGHPHVCTRCGKAFCRFCGADSHPKISCQQLTVTEAGLRTWVEQKNATRPQFKNGRRCPNCSIALSHNGGCPHMTCPCGTEFCYLCGRKYLKPLLGLQAFHTSSRMLPLITCPKLWRSQPKRILVHSLVSFGIIAGVVPMVVGLTPIVLPILLTFIAVDRCRKRIHDYS